MIPNPDLRHTLPTTQKIESNEDEPNLVNAIQAGRASDSTKQVDAVMDAQKRLSDKGPSFKERATLLLPTEPATLDDALAATPLDPPEPTILDDREIPGLFFEKNIFVPHHFDVFFDSVNKALALGTLP